MRSLVLLLLALLCAALALLAAMPRAAADVLVIDGDHVSDWASVFSPATWKQHDACFYPNTLFQFDLDGLIAAGQVNDARLHLFVERAQPQSTIELWHIQQDGWSYGLTEPATLWNWPVLHLAGTASFSDTGAISLDVTAHVQEEIQPAGNRILSLKLVDGQGQLYQSIRISSPLAAIQRMRPRLVVDYVPLTLIPPQPDLAISSQDLRMSPMRPAPGTPVTLRASVRNLGATPATNVTVAFWDGDPSSGGSPIGSVVIPSISSGGGEGVATFPWTAARGLHEILAVADPAGNIAETDESNNRDFREFLIADPPEYVTRIESFEHPGRFAWSSDFDVPKQFTYFGPKSFYINRSGAEAYHGDYATEMVLDGTADDGTIWLETAVPVDPGTTADVTVDFELFRYAADIAFFPVVAVGPLDPELEADFTVLPGSHQGWTLYQYHKTFNTGPYDMAHIAVGLTVTWETPGTFYIDLIRTVVTNGVVGVEPSPDPSSKLRLEQSRPNPTRSLATIAFNLPRDGPITLGIYDTSGRLLATLRQGEETAGFHEVRWDGTDALGRAVASGVYFYRLETAAGVESRKLMLAR